MFIHVSNTKFGQFIKESILSILNPSNIILAFKGLQFTIEDVIDKTFL